MNKTLKNLLFNEAFSKEIKKQIILHIPHSSTYIPFYDGFDLDLIDDETNLLVDIATDKIFNFEDVDSIVFEYNRIFCDVERLDDDSEPLFKKGRGFYYTNTDNGKILRELIPSVKDKIKKEFYDVHHQLLEKLTQEKLDYYKNIYIIDCHSFTDEPFLTDDDKTKNRPDICLGVDEYHTPQWLVDQLISGFEYFDLSVKINSPYSGTIVPLKYYKLDSRVKSVMIEVNRKLYMRNGLVDSDSVIKLNNIISEILFQ